MSGVTLAVKVTPRARHAGVLGRVADGTLRLSVTEPAEDGRANAAVLRLLAELLDVPTSACTLLRGAAARTKHVHVAGEPALLSARIAATLAP